VKRRLLMHRTHELHQALAKHMHDTALEKCHSAFSILRRAVTATMTGVPVPAHQSVLE